MSQLQFDRPRALSRRRFLVLSSVALGTGGLLKCFLRFDEKMFAGMGEGHRAFGLAGK